MGNLRTIYVWILRIFVSLIAVRNLLFTLFSLAMQSNATEKSYGVSDEIGAILVTTAWIYRGLAAIVLVLSALFYLNGCHLGQTTPLRFLIITDAFIAIFDFIFLYISTKNLELIGVLVLVEIFLITLMLLLLKEEVKKEEDEYREYDAVNQA